MSKHTRGPWTIGELPDYIVVNGVVDGAHTNIARIADDDPRAEANARLIAAAPEMLEALRLSTVVLEGKPHSPACVGTAIKNRALIAKIDGEEA